jgi:hypothetical protein
MSLTEHIEALREALQKPTYRLLPLHNAVRALSDPRDQRSYFSAYLAYTQVRIQNDPVVHPDADVAALAASQARAELRRVVTAYAPQEAKTSWRATFPDVFTQDVDPTLEKRVTECYESVRMP